MDDPSYESYDSAPASSGLKLKLPPLNLGKQVKGSKKSKQKSRFASPLFPTAQDEVKKAPRPLKLKPLREVLTKLVAQIKKKDDYAFFLSPVDVSKVPGYTDVIKRRMDFGTMGIKVSRGRYRSLEDFASDFKLVTSNAKLFNPPGTIYHTEADRIEVWGLDHISKAASTVIEYETDWNIEIEHDDGDDDQNINIDEDDEKAGTPMDVHEDRSPSVSSTQPQPKRGGRGPYKKVPATGTNPNPTGISESIDVDGRLPGSKEGVGAFPPGSDWAAMMLHLKLKGKRYRTKKERLRMEKGGPPYCTDGSLDYTQMEDPFSILSILVPEPPSLLRLTPLIPPSASLSRDDPSRTTKTAISLPFPYTKPAPKLATATATATSSTTSLNKRRRHWTVIRNAPTRGKTKEKDDDEADEAISPRDVRSVDWGAFAGLEGTLSHRVHTQGVVGTAEGEVEQRIMEEVRHSVNTGPRVGDTVEGENGFGYWTKGRAKEAEEYVCDVVYGGLDGLAYVRSLAEFVNGFGYTEHRTPATGSKLGMPLAQWVEAHLVDPLTGGRHALLRETADTLAHAYPAHRRDYPSAQEFRPFDPPPKCEPPPPALPPPHAHAPVAQQIRLSLSAYPRAATTLAALRQINTHQIDMGALIRAPEELFASEQAWAGKAWKRRRIEGLGLDEKGVEEAMAYEGSDMLSHVLEHTAGAIVEHDRRRREAVSAGGDQTAPPAGEPADLLDLRLNLLALAKRAPLDRIARMPPDLVPAHIRCYVPTLG